MPEGKELKMLKKFAFVFALALLAATACTAHAGLAPLSPEFLKWQEEQTKVRTAEDVNVRNYGVRPSPLNLTHLASNPVKVSATLPTSFDLRTLGVVPPIRNQAYWGTCWAFATISAIETNYLMQITNQGSDNYITAAIPEIGSAPESVDLSEMHMSWFPFMGEKLEQRYTNSAAKSLATSTSGSTVLNVGGSAGFPVTMMARGKGWGPVTEAALPYIGKDITSKKIYDLVGEDATREQIMATVDQLTDQYCAEKLGGKKQSDYASVLRLKEAAYMVTVDDEEEDGAPTLLFKQNRDAIKQLVMDKGALYVGFMANGDIKNGTYYYSGDGGGHAVALIGWDDNFSAENFSADKFGKKPAGNGAWLIRNSWGTFDDSPDGCFWMSYEQNSYFGTAFSVARADNSLTTYTHSNLGWCTSWGAGGNGNTTSYGANVFMVGSQNVNLREIGFYTTDNGADAEFSIYVSDTKPTASTLTAGQLVKTITLQGIPYAGYHTATLDSPVSVQAGQYLTIVQKAVNPSFGYPIAVMARIDNWTDFAEFYDGEGYVSTNGTEWTDGIQIMEKGKRQPVIPCINAFVTGAAEDDEGEDTMNLTINGIPVENLEDFARYINVSSDTNEKLNPNVPAARSFNLTLGGVDGNAVKEGETFMLYLLYTNDLRHWEEQPGSSSGVRYPSGDIVPVYPTGYEPDLFLTVKVTEGASLKADLPAYGPFEATTTAGGKIRLNVDNLVYADIGDVEKAGEKAKIPEGYNELLYFSQADTETSACGMVENLNVTASGSDGGDSETIGVSSSSGGCDMGMAGFAGLLVLTALIMKRK